MSSNNSDPYRNRGSLVSWFANNSVAANIVMVFLLVSGFFGVRSMITETFPALDARTITIATPYPGATPQGKVWQ